MSFEEYEGFSRLSITPLTGLKELKEMRAIRARERQMAAEAKGISLRPEHRFRRITSKRFSGPAIGGPEFERRNQDGSAGDETSHAPGDAYETSDEETEHKNPVEETDDYAFEFDQKEPATDRSHYDEDREKISKMSTGQDMPSYSDPLFRQQCRLNKKNQPWSRKEYVISPKKPEEKVRESPSDRERGWEIKENEIFKLQQTLAGAQEMFRTGYQLLAESSKFRLNKSKPKSPTKLQAKISKGKIQYRLVDNPELKNSPMGIFHYEERKESLLSSGFSLAQVENFLLGEDSDKKGELVESVEPVELEQRPPTPDFGCEEENIIYGPGWDPCKTIRPKSANPKTPKKVTFAPEPIILNKPKAGKKERKITPGLMIPPLRCLSEQGKERIRIQLAKRKLLRAQRIQKKAAAKVAKAAKELSAITEGPTAKESLNKSKKPMKATVRPVKKSSYPFELDPMIYDGVIRVEPGPRTPKPERRVKKKSPGEGRAEASKEQTTSMDRPITASSNKPKTPTKVSVRPLENHHRVTSSGISEVPARIQQRRDLGPQNPEPTKKKTIKNESQAVGATNGPSTSMGPAATAPLNKPKTALPFVWPLVKPREKSSEPHDDFRIFSGMRLDWQPAIMEGHRETALKNLRRMIVSEEHKLRPPGNNRATPATSVVQYSPLNPFIDFEHGASLASQPTKRNVNVTRKNEFPTVPPVTWAPDEVVNKPQAHPDDSLRMKLVLPEDKEKKNRPTTRTGTAGRSSKSRKSLRPIEKDSLADIKERIMSHRSQLKALAERQLPRPATVPAVKNDKIHSTKDQIQNIPPPGIKSENKSSGRNEIFKDKDTHGKFLSPDPSDLDLTESEFLLRLNPARNPVASAATLAAYDKPEEPIDYSKYFVKKAEPVKPSTATKQEPSKSLHNSIDWHTIWKNQGKVPIAKVRGAPATLFQQNNGISQRSSVNVSDYLSKMENGGVVKKTSSFLRDEARAVTADQYKSGGRNKTQAVRNDNSSDKLRKHQYLKDLNEIWNIPIRGKKIKDSAENSAKPAATRPE